MFGADGKKAVTALCVQLNHLTAGFPQRVIWRLFLCPKEEGLHTMFFGCKFLKASTERVLLRKTEKLQLLWDFCTKKVSRNRWKRCHSLSEALTVLRCWGLLQIFKFQGVPQSFQVSVTRDSPEWHVVLEWNQKRAFLGFCLILRSKQLSYFAHSGTSLVLGPVACQEGQEGRQGEVSICWHVFYAEGKTDPPQVRSALLQGCWRMQGLCEGTSS